jgi:hypothetical protein
MTDEFIDCHIDEIRQNASAIEKRLFDTNITHDSLKADNHHYIETFTLNGEDVTLIDDPYEETIKTLL